MAESAEWVYVHGSNTAHAATLMRACKKKDERLELKSASSILQLGVAWVPVRAAVSVRPNYEYDQTRCPAACNWPKQEALFKLRLQDYRKKRDCV
mmetsp:Transcript_20003/g.55699  ORF Transcript_20003/g.55699 Transcript_20003/m.55699 type:complete len:95 (+) Transcript_20003:151-435(+)